MRHFLFLLVGLQIITGCATVPYRPEIAREGVPPPANKIRDDEEQIERGRPNALIDGIGWGVGIPSKILLLNIRVNNHSISTNTEAAIRQYLAENGLTEVKVRINQYAPIDEWRRLRRNTDIGWGWRYTFGTLSWLFYTVLPGRILGGDSYNPYTDTINLYSDVPAIALHEAGHAKDFATRKQKGLYAFAYMIPGVALYHEAQATGDVMGYLREQPDAEAEKEGYHVLYPAYATYIGGGLVQIVVPISWMYYGAVGAGHAVGRVRGAGVDERRAREARDAGSGGVARDDSEGGF